MWLSSDSGIRSSLTAPTKVPTSYSAVLDSPHRIDALLYTSPTAN
jgi:hypothetical protein